MELSQAGMARLHLSALILGFFLGLLFDWIRFPRFLLLGQPTKKGTPKSNLRKRRAVAVAVFLEDFLFCVFASVCCILLFYEQNNGKIRPFALALIAGGGVLYRVSIGKWVKKLTVWLAERIRKWIRKLCGVLWKPLKKALLFLRDRLQSIYQKQKIRMEKRSRKKETAKCFRALGRTAMGLLPGGSVLTAPEKRKEKQGKSHGNRRKKDHRPKQKSVA